MSDIFGFDDDDLENKNRAVEQDTFERLTALLQSTVRPLGKQGKKDRDLMKLKGSWLTKTLQRQAAKRGEKTAITDFDFDDIAEACVKRKYMRVMRQEDNDDTED